LIEGAVTTGTAEALRKVRAIFAAAQLDLDKAPAQRAATMNPSTVRDESRDMRVPIRALVGWMQRRSAQ